MNLNNRVNHLHLHQLKPSSRCAFQSNELLAARHHFTQQISNIEQTYLFSNQSSPHKINRKIYADLNNPEQN